MQFGRWSGKYTDQHATPFASFLLSLANPRDGETVADLGPFASLIFSFFFQQEQYFSLATNQLKQYFIFFSTKPTEQGLSCIYFDEETGKV